MKSRLQISEYAGFGVIAAGLCGVAIANPLFASWGNLTNILLQASIIGIISLGMTLVIVAAGIDLSVGAVAALSGILLAKANAAGWPEIASLLFAVTSGLACGSLIGISVVKFRVPSFIASLGVMGVARGCALVISDGRPLSHIGGISTLLGSGSIFGFAVPSILFIALAAVFHVFLKHTIWGTRIYAIGGNMRAAWIAGVPVEKYVGCLYAACGLLAGIAGVVLAGRVGSAQPLGGNLYELDAITATVVGGATLSGGRGSAVGSAVGAVLLAAVRNAMVLINLSPNYHPIVIGGILIIVLVTNARPSDRSNAFGSS